MKWGLIPSYTKKDEKLDFFRMFNARSETVSEKPAFRRLVHSKRAIVAMHGYFEWHKPNSFEHQPYYVTLTSGIMYMAALYDSWKSNETDKELFTFTLLTKEATNEVAWIHHRMPVNIHSVFFNNRY